MNIDDGIPYGGDGTQIGLSEMASIQLEFRYILIINRHLSKVSNNKTYEDISMKVYEEIIQNKQINGLYPINISLINYP